MGLTITHKNPISLGSMNGVTCFVAFDDSYPTGGESLTPGMLGMQQIVGVIAGNASGYMFEYDYANQKLKAFTPGAAGSCTVALPVTDVADGTSGKALVVIEEATGPPVVPAHLAAELTGDSANISVALTGTLTATAGGEVGNATNLSALTNVPIFAIGY